MATREEVYQAILQADQAGDGESVRTLGAYLQTMSSGFQPPPPEQQGAFSSGISSYLPQLQETYGGIKTLLGVGAERMLGEGDISKGLISSGARSIQEANAAQAPLVSPERTSFTSALDKGAGSVFTEYLPYQAGAGVTNLLESLGVMGAGSLLGSAVPGVGTAAGAVTGLVEKELVKRGVKEAAEAILKERGQDAAKEFVEQQAKSATASVAAKVGATTALAGQAGFYGAGQTTNRAVEEAQKMGGSATDIELARVLPASAVSAVAEFIGDKIGVGALKGLEGASPNFAFNIAKQILLTGTKEAPVEVIQQTAERFGAKLSLTDAEAIKEYIDSAAGAYAMSVVPGGVGGARGSLQAMTEAKAQGKEPLVEKPVEPPVAPPVEQPLTPSSGNIATPTEPLAILPAETPQATEQPALGAPPVPLAIVAPPKTEPVVEPPPGVPPTLPSPPTPPVEPPPVEPPAPVTPEPPVEVPPAAPVEPKAPPTNWDENYHQGLPDEANTVFQNRDRSSPASISQMQGISSKPDYDRASISREFSSGAPVVISDIKIPENQMGKVDTATASDGTKIPVRYAVVEDSDLIASHTADGSKVAAYANLKIPGIRAIAGNGRIAGLQAAYAKDNMHDYIQALASDAASHGISAETVNALHNPVLVRIMPKSQVTPNIGDLSNQSGGLGFNPVEQAKTDMKRVDLGGLDFHEDGTPTAASLMQFIRSMPKEEGGKLMDEKGMPNTQAVDRLNNAIFYRAYGSDALVNLYAQTIDPDAKQVLSALARVAPKMSQLEGAGDYDIRNTVIQAAEAAVNARRQGLKISDYAKNASIGMDENTRKVLDMFAEHSRSGKKMAESLDRLADLAYEQTKSEPDMFGDKPKVPVDSIFDVLKGEPTEPDLFGEPPAAPPAAPPAPPPPPAAPPPPPVAPPKPPPAAAPPVAPKPPGASTGAYPNATPGKPKSFDGKKSKEQIAGEVRGMTVPELAQWAVDNAPNEAARVIAEKVLARLKQFDAKNIFARKVRIQNDGARNTKGTRGRMTLRFVGTKPQITIMLNGLVKGQADSLTGTRYITILHELLHAATYLQLQLGTDKKIANDLTVILNKVKLQIKADIKAGKSHPILDQIARVSNTVKDIHELVSWGLTHHDFQDYLSTIKVGNTNAFDRIVEIFRQVLGIAPKYETALDAVVRASSEILDVPVSKIAVGTGITLDKSGKPKGSSDKTGSKAAQHQRMAETTDGYVFYEQPDGTWSDQPGEDQSNVDMVFDSIDDLFADNPDLIVDGKLYSPKAAQQDRDVGGSQQFRPFDPIDPNDRFETDDNSGSPTAAERLRKAGQEAYQKRKPLDSGAFQGVPEDLFNKLGGVFAPRNETILDRIEGMKDNFWQRVAQGVADQYRTIKEYSEDAYMKARMSKTIDGGLEGLMFHGQVFNDGGALNIRKNTKGLLEVLKPVGKELDRYLIWVALSRDSTMPSDKRSISDDLVSRRNELVEGTINGQPRLEVFKKVQKEMNALNRSVLKVAVDAGLLNTTEGAIKDIQGNDKLSDKEKSDQIAELIANPIGYEKFINDLNYIPFYKVMEDGDTQNVSTASGLTSQYFSKALKGGEKPFGDLMENTLRNWSHILSASMKNQAASATIDAAVDHGAAKPNLKPGFDMRNGMVYHTQSNKMVGDGSLRPNLTHNEKGAVKIMVEGQPTYYKVTDPLLMDAISAIGYMGPQSKFLDVAKDFKNLLQYGVTLSPAFKVNNLIRDSVSAMSISELKKNPIANVIQGISLSDKNNETYIAGLSGGAIFNFGSAYEGDQSRLIKRLVKQGAERDSILDTKQRILKGLQDSFDKYNEWGNKSESANRLALYKQLRDAGMSHLEASFKARDLLDFSMQGSWPAFRFLTQTIPFLNARVQGLYKLGKDGIIPTYRVLHNKLTGEEITGSDKQKAQSFAVVATAVGLASAVLYLAFKDDEDFKKRDEWDRDNFWWIKLPGMDYALRIPKPFEMGAIGTLIERTLEQIFDSGAEGKQFTDSLFRTLSNTFALNPTPQMIKPMLDLYANKDSFTGAPIESAGLEKLSKQERKIDTTSPLAIAVGAATSIGPQALELSPVQVDYLMKGYFGWLGATASAMSTAAVAPFKEGEYPDVRWMDKAALGLIKELPTNQSKYVTAFYEANKEISQAFADMRHYQSIGDADKALEVFKEKGDLIALSKMYDQVSTQMGKMRTQIQIVTNDPTMDGAAKADAIDRMKMMIGQMAQQTEEIRKSMKP